MRVMRDCCGDSAAKLAPLINDRHFGDGGGTCMAMNDRHQALAVRHAHLSIDDLRLCLAPLGKARAHNRAHSCCALDEIRRPQNEILLSERI